MNNAFGSWHTSIEICSCALSYLVPWLDLDFFRERLHSKRVRSDTKEGRRGP